MKRTFEATRQMLLSCIDAGNGNINFHLLSYKLNSNEKLALLNKLLSLYGLTLEFNPESEILELIQITNKEPLTEELKRMISEKTIFQTTKKLSRLGKVKDVRI